MLNRKCWMAMLLLGLGHISAFSSPAYASAIVWGWNNQADGALGWNSSSTLSGYSYAPFWGSYATAIRYSGIEYQSSFGDGNIVSRRQHGEFLGYYLDTRAKNDYTFSSAPFQGNAGIRLISFDVRATNGTAVESISVAGKNVPAIFVQPGATAKSGWTHYTVPVGATVSSGGALNIGLSFVNQQEEVAIDNVVATIFNPSTVKVRLDGTVYAVPIGYANFTGAQDANGNPITVTAETAGKLLATSQALGDLAKFNPSVADTVAQLVEAGFVNTGITAIRDSLIAGAGNFVSNVIDPIPSVDGYVSDYLNGMQIVGDVASSLNLLKSATFNAQVISQASGNLSGFQSRLTAAQSTGSPIEFVDIKSASEGLRLIQGAAQTTQLIVSTATADSGLDSAFKSITDQVANVAGGVIRQAAVVQGHQLLESAKNRSTALTKLGQAIATNIDAQVWSPLDSRGLSAYAAIAVERGYTNQVVQNPLSGVVAPNLMSADPRKSEILMGNATNREGERQFALTVSPQISFLIDPIVATGFEYVVDEGPGISSVALPVGFGDSIYDLWLFDAPTNSYYDSMIDLLGGTEYRFGLGGVSRFQIRGIETDAGLDPVNHGAFIAEIGFADYGDVVMRVNPMTENVYATVPEPATYNLMLTSLGLLGVMLRRRKQHAS